MVEHDETRVQAWTQARERQQETGKRHTALHLSVVAVQSIACCVAVLLALLLRVAGGNAYRSLQQSFREALTRNEWVSALALLWDGDPLEQVGDVDVKETDFTGNEPAQMTDTSVWTASVPLIDGTLTSGYGERVHPIDGTQEFHTGVDIAAPIGADLLAVGDGVVTEVGEDAQLGKYVCLRYGDVDILYGHCAEIVATVGAQVKVGERVALVGSTGVSTGSHVHIRVTVDGETCDPATVLPLERYA